MRVRLLKRFINEFGDYKIGTVINFGGSTAQKLIDQGIAEKYIGKYPPPTKMKTDFFKPK